MQKVYLCSFFLSLPPKNSTPFPSWKEAVVSWWDAIVSEEQNINLLIFIMLPRGNVLYRLKHSMQVTPPLVVAMGHMLGDYYTDWMLV